MERGEEWDGRRELAARLLLDGQKVRDGALAVGVSGRQVYRWMNEPEYFCFQNENFARIRGSMLLEAHQCAHALQKENRPSRRDQLDWLKFIWAETEKIDYSDPAMGIPHSPMVLYMNKNTRNSMAQRERRKRGAGCRTGLSPKAKAIHPVGWPDARKWLSTKGGTKLRFTDIRPGGRTGRTQKQPPLTDVSNGNRLAVINTWLVSRTKRRGNGHDRNEPLQSIA